MEKKKGLVYTAKNKKAVKGIIEGREIHGLPESKVLKLEFDYDDLKNSGKAEVIENPELRGSKNWKEWMDKKPRGIFSPEKGSPIDKIISAAEYEMLGPESTHVFKGDIDSKNIVGGKGYKKRTAKQVINYIKKNPKRFGKEAAKVAAGVGAVGTGASLVIKKDKKK